MQPSIQTAVSPLALLAALPLLAACPSDDGGPDPDPVPGDLPGVYTLVSVNGEDLPQLWIPGLTEVLTGGTADIEPGGAFVLRFETDAPAPHTWQGTWSWQGDGALTLTHTCGAVTSEGCQPVHYDALHDGDAITVTINGRDFRFVREG